MKIDWTNINSDNAVELQRGWVVKGEGRYLLITSAMDSDGDYYITDVRKDMTQTEETYVRHTDIIGWCYIDTGVFDILLELLEK